MLFLQFRTPLSTIIEYSLALLMLFELLTLLFAALALAQAFAIALALALALRRSERLCIRGWRSAGACRRVDSKLFYLSITVRKHTITVRKQQHKQTITVRKQQCDP